MMKYRNIVGMHDKQKRKNNVNHNTKVKNLIHFHNIYESQSKTKKYISNYYLIKNENNFEIDLPYY